MKNQYEYLARVYDDFMYDVPYADWVDFLCGLLKDGGIAPGAKLLEYACGTGGITAGLARAGYGVTALDCSEEMLTIATKKMKKQALQVNLVCADMAEFCLNHPVDAAVCACDGVNYLLDEADVGRFFMNAYGNLTQNGMLLFDVSSEGKLSRKLGNEFFYDDGEEQTLFWQNEYDATTRKIDMNITLFIADGGVYQRFDECHTQRAWKDTELVALLQQAGFKDIGLCDFNTRGSITRDSDRIQFLAVK